MSRTSNGPWSESKYFSSAVSGALHTDAHPYACEFAILPSYGAGPQVANFRMSLEQIMQERLSIVLYSSIGTQTVIQFMKWID